MENSSKALLIAAAVLIVILIVTISIKILSPVEGTKEQVEEIGGAMSGASQSAVGKLQSLMGINTGSGNSTEQITNYTAEQIEADEHLYAIGKNKSTDVVAEFNNNYSQVTIKKNGEKSDGIVRGFDVWEVSPITSKKATLKTAIIKEGVSSILTGGGGGGLFGWCTSLTNVTIPNSIKEMGEYTFYNCTNLKSVTIPNSISSIGMMAFFNCTSLTSINIPNSITSISDSAFSGCSGLTNVTIPNSVTEMGEYTFYNCSNLKSVTIPNSVKSIGDNTFCNISASSTIYCQSQDVANLLIDGKNYESAKTKVSVDASKF